MNTNSIRTVCWGVVVSLAALLPALGCGKSNKDMETLPSSMTPEEVKSTIEILSSPKTVTMFNRDSKITAAEGLGRAGAAAKDAIPILEKLSTSHKDPEVKKAAAEALQKIKAS